MTATPFVASLRARPETVHMAGADAAALTIRAQLAEAWDTVRISASANESIESVKMRALEALDPSSGAHSDYLITLGGTEILDEGATLATIGVKNGATLLIEQRHRRPVR